MKRTSISDNCRNKDGRLVDTSKYNFEVLDGPAENERPRPATCGGHYSTTNMYHNLATPIVVNCRGRLIMTFSYCTITCDTSVPAPELLQPVSPFSAAAYPAQQSNTKKGNMKTQPTGERLATKKRFHISSLCGFVLTLFLGLSMSPAEGADVWLDFTTGAGPDWVDRLNEATTNVVGVSDFSKSERITIESNILSYLETAFDDFLIDFSLTDPGGTRERINMGASTTSTGTYGIAPIDFLNDNTGTQKIYTANFDNFLESSDSRAKQIDEISVSLAGTTAHELGHSLGMRHHASYGTAGITPANYSNTGGLQNSHILATGKTGINETERETVRTFSRWSRLSMEAASVIPLVASPLPHTSEDLTDAGDTPSTAQSLTLTFRPISGFNAAVVVGAEIDAPALGSSTYDVDVYSFSGSAGDLLSAEIWSDSQYSDDFDSQLTLIGPDGLTTIYSNADVMYNGDAFGSGSKRQDDSFLLNIPLTQTGIHYLKVESLGADPEHTGGDADGQYDLLVGLWAVPEPGSGMLALCGLISLIGFCRFRTRNRSSFTS